MLSVNSLIPFHSIQVSSGFSFCLSVVSLPAASQSGWDLFLQNGTSDPPWTDMFGSTACSLPTCTRASKQRYSALTSLPWERGYPSEPPSLQLKSAYSLRYPAYLTYRPSHIPRAMHTPHPAIPYVMECFSRHTQAHDSHTDVETYNPAHSGQKHSSATLLRCFKLLQAC